MTIITTVQGPVVETAPAIPKLNSTNHPQTVVDTAISQLEPQILAVNRTIYDHPELCYEEVVAHDTIVVLLKSLGHNVTEHAYGINTSFESVFEQGTDGQEVVFNAEYDALPGIGHACGHNLIAISGIVAYLSLCAALQASPDVSGRVRLLGTPAEEGGAGKVKLLEAGAYKGADACLMAHPSSSTTHGSPQYTGTAGWATISRTAVVADFIGKPAHAGGNPWDGINALDALVSAYTSVAMLRQQIRPEQRIHACILDAPKVGNVIPPHTRVQFATRSPTYGGARSLQDRVIKCLEGAAVATGCTVNYEKELPYLDTRLNDTINARYVVNMARYGEAIRQTADEPMSASTDMGNVTYEMPGLHAFFGIPCPDDVSGHHPSFTAASGTPEAFQSAIRCGKGLALTGWDLMVDDKIMEGARADFEEDKTKR
ncbi:hypothetical protein Sste5346_008757 [Sporothrix stenoceras]|uniref:Peptidase M20 domain-containing protein 2 n=1 Tax=Sporothrix stenoceras TaxID=5173 RepID=A0ABR3YN60_9PEZI